MRPMHVELDHQALRHEVFHGKGPRQGYPVLVGQFGIGRERQHDLAGNLRVLPFFRRLRRIPQHAAIAERLGRPLGQQHLVVLGRVAVLEVEELARPLGLDRLAGVIGR
jgi:hypothetical protein